MSATGQILSEHGPIDVREVQRGAPETDSPFGDMTRQLGTFSMDDVDVGAMMAWARRNYEHVDFQIVGDAPGSARAAQAEVARKMQREEDYQRFLQMRRHRAVLDHVKHGMTLNIMSKSGATVKQAIPVVFPLFDGGYDQFRSERIYGDHTDANWWLSHQAVVMTKMDHLPTLAIKRTLSNTINDERDRMRADERMPQTDLPDDLKHYPRPSAGGIPEPGEMDALVLQGSLMEPVEFDDKAVFRVDIQGMEGTTGELFKTRHFTGKELRVAMQSEFKSRKGELVNLKKRVDSNPINAVVDVMHTRGLTSGASFPVMANLEGEEGSVNLRENEALVVMQHLAWTNNSDTRKLVLTGISTVHSFLRPLRETATDVTCAVCLDDITGQSWTCTACSQKIHHGCFDEWCRSCHKNECVITCPLCRHEL